LQLLSVIARLEACNLVHYHAVSSAHPRRLR
jgi:hypothetical protein